MALSDAPERAAAIDPLHSFCVSAPAGSGKTELLIQRYLGLLSRVHRPEQVLAITFTRKAAAEMRERVVQALQSAHAQQPCANAHQQITRTLADAVLVADTQFDWGLLHHLSRFNIRTIDGFCAGLARQLPILSQIGGETRIADDGTPLYAEAVRELYALLDDAHPVAADLEALLLHFDNNWDRLQELLTAMLACREQWRDYVGVHAAPAESEAYLIHNVEALVSDALAHTARLLSPCATPLLELLQYAAANLSSTVPTDLPGVAARHLPDWYRVTDLLLTAAGEWRKSPTRDEGFPAGKGEAKRRKEQWRELRDALRQITGLRESLAAIRSLPAIHVDSTSWRIAVHLSRLLPLLAAQLLLVFRKHAVIDHSHVAQSALLALGDDDTPTDLSLRLDYRIEHILVDEFQDTSITQFELLHRLTRGWGEHNHLHPLSPRTLLIVGDGMQSIYGFRGANVGLFLRAQQQGFNGVLLRHLRLRCNFRSAAGVVNWVNETFQRAFPPQDDASRSHVRYSAATAVRAVGDAAAVEAHGFTGDDARAQEVAHICAAIDSGLRQEAGAIAVLGRNRSHLQAILQRLKQAQIPCNAPELDSLAHSPAVFDLLTLCRALANDFDRLAWAALLRAPWCGLQLADLLTVAGAPPTASIWATLHSGAVDEKMSADGRSRVQHILPALRWARAKRDRLALRVWIEQTWVGLGGPACATDTANLRDADSFLQLLEDADAAGRGLDLDWLSTQVNRRYMAAGNPDSRVHLLTLHRAKGLEFDRVIIPQLDRLPRRDDREILLWDEHSNSSGERAFLLAADDHAASHSPTLYNFLRLQRRQKSLQENTRLLYVGATRAISHLLLTASVTHDARNQRYREPPAHSLLRCIWPTFEAQMQVHRGSSAQAPAHVRHAFPALARLRRPLVDTPAPSANGAAVSGTGTPLQVEQNPMELAIGSVVHLALEELSRRTILPERCGDDDRQRWRAALQRLGVWGTMLEPALQSVTASVAASLQGDGRWVLAPTHSGAHSEWALTAVDASGDIRDIVIDRSFVDPASGKRWVIDYKNSRPAPGESLQTFIARQQSAYIDQLRRYRDAVHSLENTPVRCALFFTALGLLHAVPALDLPTAEDGIAP